MPSKRAARRIRLMEAVMPYEGFRRDHRENGQM